MDLNILGADSHRKSGPATGHRVNERAGNVEVGNRISKFVGLGRLQFHRPFTNNVANMTAAAGGFEIAEQLFQQS